MVHKSCLNKLLARCPNCGKECLSPNRFTTGSQLTVKFECNKCPEEQKWASQPIAEGQHNFPQGNLDLAASISFTGASPSRVLRVLNYAGVQTISEKTYFMYQSTYLQPTIYNAWRLQQEVLFEKLRNSKEALVLGGDGRSDSPGHSAKYGTYSFMDLTANRVIDFKIVQV